MDADLPVLVLTARQEVDTRVRCFDRGADDLMTKPFSLHELRARCRALLRRKRETRLQLRAGDLELDRLDHSARRGGRAIVLTNKEFALLEHLLLNRGQCVSRVELLDSVWNLEPAQTTNIVDVYVNYLRRKLADPPPGHLIRTVRGQGYMVPSEAELALTVPIAVRVAAIDALPAPPVDSRNVAAADVTLEHNSLSSSDEETIMRPFPVPVLPASTRITAAHRAGRRAPIAASANGSLFRCSPACAGRCAKPRAAPRPGLRPRPRGSRGDDRRLVAARSRSGRVS
jgi:DNA-binding winged helix-turn-helix (wHTH) protein